MDTNQITIRQATMLFFLHQLGSAFLLLPGSLTTIAKQDAWISILFSLLFSSLLFVLYYGLIQQMNGASFSEHIQYLLGDFLGRVFLITFIFCYPFLIFMTALRDLGDFLDASFLTTTPNEATYFIILLAIFYVVKSGLSTIGRLAELLFFVVIALIAIGYLPLLPDIQLFNIKPFFESGLKPVIAGSFVLFSFPYFENILLLFLIKQLNKPQKWKSILIKSTWLSGSVFLFVTFLSIGLLSEGVTANIRYPSVFIVRTISIANFFERFEVLVAVLWYITIFFRLSLLMYVTISGLGAGFKLKKPDSMLLPLLLITLIGATIIWENISHLIEILNIWPYYALVFGLVFPLFLFLIGLIKGKKATSFPSNEKTEEMN